ncbi:MAG: tetratricopeptide repeat protein [Deltaproteobacteria bacterium]|nr:tetratricopeptide repeat protein [Deltaproteobacteria bacterium]
MIRIRLLMLTLLVVIAGCAIPQVVNYDDPLSPEEHLNLGIAYEKDGEFENAIREYKAAARRLPVAYLYLGNVHFQNNELDQAEKYYEKAIKKESHNADVHNNLAWLYYIKEENLDKAENLALRAMELDPLKRDVYMDTLEKIRTLKGSNK